MNENYLKLSMSFSLTESISHLIQNLLPEVAMTVTHTRLEVLRRYIPGLKPGLVPRFGEALFENEAYLWFEVPTNEFAVIKLERKPWMRFSPAEKRLLSYCAPCIKSLLGTIPRSRSSRSDLRLATRQTFLHLLIARFMRGSAYGNVWAPGLILTKLSELALERYENTNCSSGFLSVSDPKKSLKALGSTGFDFLPIREVLPVGEGVFDQPFSHRYVDGRHSFFLVDKMSQVLGVIRSRRPHMVRDYNRAIYQHLLPLTRLHHSRCWAAFVGQNEDVNVLFSDGSFARFLRSRWRFIDPLHLTVILERKKIEPRTADLLIAAVFLASEHRLGALILVPKYSEQNPSTVAAIDGSEIGLHLRSTIARSSFETLMNSRAALGILTSDGMTTVYKDGSVGEVGAIIEIKRREERNGLHGGGRTQAALAASRLGVVLKVSEDGPISVFDGGERILSLNL